MRLWSLLSGLAICLSSPVSAHWVDARAATWIEAPSVSSVDICIPTAPGNPNGLEEFALCRYADVLRRTVLQEYLPNSSAVGGSVLVELHFVFDPPPANWPDHQPKGHAPRLAPAQFGAHAELLPLERWSRRLWPSRPGFSRPKLTAGDSMEQALTDVVAPTGQIALPTGNVPGNAYRASRQSRSRAGPGGVPSVSYLPDLSLIAATDLTPNEGALTFGSWATKIAGATDSAPALRAELAPVTWVPPLARTAPDVLVANLMNLPNAPSLGLLAILGLSLVAKRRSTAG